MALERSGPREQLLDAFVDVAEPLLEPQHLLADDRKTKVPGLDDAGVHGADGYFVHAVARHAHERIVVGAQLRGLRWRAACGERPIVGRPRRVA